MAERDQSVNSPCHPDHDADANLDTYNTGTAEKEKGESSSGAGKRGKLDHQVRLCDVHRATAMR